MSSMPASRWWGLCVTFVVSVMLIGATALHAKDLCIDTDETTANPEFVAMNFTLPKPGKCRSFAGLYWPGDGVQKTSVQGVACTPSSGERVNFTLTVGHHNFDDRSVITFYTMGIRLPALQAHMFKRDQDSTDGVGFVGSAYVCKSSLFL